MACDARALEWVVGIRTDVGTFKGHRVVEIGGIGAGCALNGRVYAGNALWLARCAMPLIVVVEDGGGWTRCVAIPVKQIVAIDA